MYFWKVENNSTKVPKVFVADYYDDENERDGGEDERDGGEVGRDGGEAERDGGQDDGHNNATLIVFGPGLSSVMHNLTLFTTTVSSFINIVRSFRRSCAYEKYCRTGGLILKYHVSPNIL